MDCPIPRTGAKHSRCIVFWLLKISYESLVRSKLYRRIKAWSPPYSLEHRTKNSCDTMKQDVRNIVRLTVFVVLLIFAYFLFIRLFVCLLGCLFVFLFVCLVGWLFICLFVLLVGFYVCAFVRSFVRLFVRACVCSVGCLKLFFLSRERNLSPLARSSVPGVSAFARCPSV